MDYFTAIDNDDMLAFKLLLHQNSDIHVRNQHGEPILYYACKMFKTDFILELLEHEDPFDMSQDHPAGILRIIIAAHSMYHYREDREFIDMFKLMMSKGASIKAIGSRYTRILSSISRLQNTVYLDILIDAGLKLQKTDLKYLVGVNSNDKEYLHDLLSREIFKPDQSLSMVEYLPAHVHAYILENCPGIYDLSVVNEYGQTPAIFHSKYGRSRVSEVMITAGADPNHVDNYGYSLIDYLSSVHAEEFCDKFSNIKPSPPVDVTKEELDAIWNMDVTIEDLNVSIEMRHRLCDVLVNDKISILEKEHTDEDIYKFMYFMAQMVIRNTANVSKVLDALSKRLETLDKNVFPLYIKTILEISEIRDISAIYSAQIISPDSVFAFYEDEFNTFLSLDKSERDRLLSVKLNDYV